MHSHCVLSLNFVLRTFALSAPPILLFEEHRLLSKFLVTHLLSLCIEDMHFSIHLAYRSRRKGTSQWLELHAEKRHVPMARVPCRKGTSQWLELHAEKRHVHAEKRHIPVARAPCRERHIPVARAPCREKAHPSGSSSMQRKGTSQWLELHAHNNRSSCIPYSILSKWQQIGCCFHCLPIHLLTYHFLLLHCRW